MPTAIAPTVEIEAHKLIIRDSDHGGYIGGYCLMCSASGWLIPMKLVHKSGCKVASALQHPTEDDSSVTLTRK